MDKAERTRLKTLANDAVIATYGYDTRESQLAEALERCVDELEDANGKCPTCSVCEDHGDLLAEKAVIDADDVDDVHRDLAKHLTALKTYHVKLVEKLTDYKAASDLADELVELIEKTESTVDELEVMVIA